MTNAAFEGAIETGFSLRLGCRVGMTYATWPLAKMEVSRSGITIAMWSLLGVIRHDVPRAKVASIRERGFLPGLLLRVTPDATDLPEEIVLSVGNSRALMQRLGALGYPVNVSVGGGAA